MCDGSGSRADFSCGDDRCGADHFGRGGRNRSVDFNCGFCGADVIMKSCGGLVGLKRIFADYTSNDREHVWRRLK